MYLALADKGPVEKFLFRMIRPFIYRLAPRLWNFFYRAIKELNPKKLKITLRLKIGRILGSAVGFRTHAQAFFRFYDIVVFDSRS